MAAKTGKSQKEKSMPVDVKAKPLSEKDCRGIFKEVTDAARRPYHGPAKKGDK